MPWKFNLKIHPTSNKQLPISSNRKTSETILYILWNLFGYEGFSPKLLAQWYPFHASHNIAEPLKMIFFKGAKLCVWAEKNIKCNANANEKHPDLLQSLVISALIFPISTKSIPFLILKFCPCPCPLEAQNFFSCNSGYNFRKMRLNLGGTVTMLVQKAGR